MQGEFEAKRVAIEKEIESTQKALQELVRTAKASSASAQPGEGQSQIPGASLPPEKVPESRALNETLNRLKREALELRSQARDALRTRILTAVQDFARKGGYSMIFDRARAGVVYIESQVDVTQALIEWMDQKQSQ